MVNTSSAAIALSTSTSTCSTSLLSETLRPFSVAPFEHSTFVSVTKPSFATSSFRPSSIHTGEHCTWASESDALSCSAWTWTADIPTSFSVPTPTGGYETSEPTYSFTQADYTCTDFVCVNSVASSYGYSLCIPASVFETPTQSRPLHVTTRTTTIWVPVTCDPALDPEDCPGTSLDLSDSGSFTMWPTVTTSECDGDATVTASVTWSSTDACGIDIDCWSSIDFTTPESQAPFSTDPTSQAPLSTDPTSKATPSMTITKPSYSYQSTSTQRTNTSTTSDCDLQDDDCTAAATGEVTAWHWQSNDVASGRTTRTTVSPSASK